MRAAKDVGTTLVGGLGGLALPGTAVAHHPGSDAAGPWIWLALLIGGLGLVAMWPLFAFLKRRRTPPSERPPRPEQ